MHDVVRGVVLVLGVALVALGAVLQWAQPGAGIGPALAGALIVASALLEGRYHRSLDATRPRPGWQATGEKFRDEERGGWVQVWYDPASGERHYLPARRD